MKKSRVLNSHLLATQHHCRLFSEWLRRHDLYYKFVRNLSRSIKHDDSIDRLFFDYIRCLTMNPCLFIGDAINAAFSFVDTPEGFSFWMHASREWAAFCKIVFNK